MYRSLTAHVAGHPAPQGSKSGFVGANGKVRMVEKSKRVKPWRAAVEAEMRAAAKASDWATLDEACRVKITFYMPRPKSVTRDLPTVSPDLDKLVRSTLDALTSSKVIADDKLVVGLEACKVYDDDYRAGALITVSAG